MADKITCLLVDDDEDDREIFCAALEDVNKDFTCISVENGQEALDKLLAENSRLPDFIFLDLNMSVMDGKTFLQEVKSVPRLRDVPVIIYTTSSYSKDIAETKELGASHYMVKPANIDTLTDMLSGLFHNPPSSFSIN
jgi:CheY-like chemotaxis protein